MDMAVQISFEILQTRVQCGEAWACAVRQRVVLVISRIILKRSPSSSWSAIIIRIGFATVPKCGGAAGEFPDIMVNKRKGIAPMPVNYCK